MERNIEFLVDLLIIFISIKAGNVICKKFKQPMILGQTLVGLIIGTAGLGLINNIGFINELGEIGIILLMFVVGIETNLEELKNSFSEELSIALGGVIVPFILGGLGMFLIRGNMNIVEAVFIGSILTATSVGVTVETLGQMGKLKTKQGVSVLGAAIIDDIIGIVLLAIVVGLIGKQDAMNVPFVIAKMILFFLVIFIANKLFKFILNKNYKIRSTLKSISSSSLLNISIIFILFFSVISEELGVSSFIGSYFLGVLISNLDENIKEDVYKQIMPVSYGFFIPIFFVSIGVGISLDNVSSALLIGGVLTFIGIVSKIIGCGIGAKLVKFTTRESLQIGISMIPRAEVALIVANIGVNNGIIGYEILTATILLVAISTIVTPLLLKISYNNE
jgi:Kef-type K+ transport system membrane component KefB